MKSREEMIAEVEQHISNGKSYAEIKSLYPDVPSYALHKWYNTAKLISMAERHVVSY